MALVAGRTQDMGMLRLLLGVIVGFVGGSVVMMACHFVAMPLYPPPEGLDVMDPANEAEIHAWMQTLPDGAFVVASLAHWIGAAFGALIAMFIAGRTSWLPALIVGAVFTVAGIYNITSVPHPGWFPYVDIPGYLIVTALIGRWLAKGSDNATPERT